MWVFLGLSRAEDWKGAPQCRAEGAVLRFCGFSNKSLTFDNLWPFLMKLLCSRQNAESAVAPY